MFLFSYVSYVKMMQISCYMYREKVFITPSLSIRKNIIRTLLRSSLTDKVLRAVCFLNRLFSHSNSIFTFNLEPLSNPAQTISSNFDRFLENLLEPSCNSILCFSWSPLWAPRSLLLSHKTFKEKLWSTLASRHTRSSHEMPPMRRTQWSIHAMRTTRLRKETPIPRKPSSTLASRPTERRRREMMPRKKPSLTLASRRMKLPSEGPSLRGPYRILFERSASESNVVASKWRRVASS